VNIDPDTLNLDSKGKWITGYIEFPFGDYDVMTVDVDTVTLNGTVPAENDPKYEFVSDPEPVDKDGDGLMEFMVKFDRVAVQDMLSPADAVTLSVRGEIPEGAFEGSDTIRAIQKGGKTINSSADSKFHNNKSLLKVGKHLVSQGHSDDKAKITISLLATGNLPVKAVFVKEYIPGELAVKTFDGIFTGFGMMWVVGTVEHKETLTYTLGLPMVTEPTTFELRTVVEYQTLEDLEVLEKTSYLTVSPKGVKLAEGKERKSVKAKGKGYSKVHWGRPSFKGGGGASHGKKKGHDKDKGKPDKPEKPDKPPKDPGAPDKPENPPKDKEPGKPENPGKPDKPPKDPGTPDNPGKPGKPPKEPGPDEPENPSDEPGDSPDDNNPPSEPGNPSENPGNPDPGPPDNPG
jgi:hypothetical protein